ncbi:MAG: pilus assembly protein TadG-related protein [Flavobacteriaceae bacterium]
MRPPRRKTARQRKTLSLVGQIRRFIPAADGGTAIMAAVILAMSILFAAIAVDGGALYLERRKMQGLTDLAAIAAATNVNAPVTAAELFMRENGYAGITVSGNPGSGADLLVETGNYEANPALAVESRFRAGASPANAARLTFSRKGNLYFGGGVMDKPQIRTSGLAYASADAAFSIGSRLASINGGLLNAIVGELIGGSISLSVMDYEALLDTRIDLLKFLDGAAAELDITVGTYDDVLDGELSLGDIARIAASLAEAQSGRAASALTTVSSSGEAATIEVPLARLVDLGALGQAAIGTGSAVFNTSIGLMELVAASAAIADGSNQVRLSLNSALPGVASTTVDLAIGEPPQSSSWFAVGGRGTIVRTAQTRLYVKATVGGSGLLSAVSITLPVYLELAYGEARLADISCTAGSLQGLNVDIEARPGIASAWIAEVDPARLRNFASSPDREKARFVNTALIKAKGMASADIGNMTAQTLSFDYNDMANGTVKSVSTRNYTESLTATLLGDLDIDVQIGGLSLISPDAIASLLAQTLQPVAQAVDSLLYNLLSMLGVKVGEADIRVHGARCSRAVLVQ